MVAGPNSRRRQTRTPCPRSVTGQPSTAFFRLFPAKNFFAGVSTDAGGNMRYLSPSTARFRSIPDIFFMTSTTSGLPQWPAQSQTLFNLCSALFRLVQLVQGPFCSTKCFCNSSLAPGPSLRCLRNPCNLWLARRCFGVFAFRRPFMPQQPTQISQITTPQTDSLGLLRALRPPLGI
jgi:hypothetical protein